MTCSWQLQTFMPARQIEIRFQSYGKRLLGTTFISSQDFKAQLCWTQPRPHARYNIHHITTHTHTHRYIYIYTRTCWFLSDFDPNFQTILLGLRSPVEANLAQSHTTSRSLLTWLPLCFVFISCIVECFGLDKSCDAVRIDLGTWHPEVASASSKGLWHYTGLAILEQ